MEKRGIVNRQSKIFRSMAVCAILYIAFALLPVADAQNLGVAVVSTRAQWNKALSEATAGRIDVIRIAPGSTIDITRENPWQIPADVRIEGNAENTVLITRAAWENHNWSALQTAGPGVVISGIILRGPLTGTCSWPVAPGTYVACDPPPVDDSWYSGGVHLGHIDSIVEFSDISGFIHHGVVATPGTRVYANHIHHNGRRSLAQRGDMGYGVAVYGYTNEDLPLIDYNLFSHHRHAIATPGKPADGSGAGSSYEARYNRVVGPNRGHVFDVHGWNESPTRHHLPNDAGDTFILHGNVVIENDFPAFSFRGTPSGSALVDGNCFTRHAYWGVQEFPVYENGVEVSRSKIWDSDPMENITLTPRNQGGCKLPAAATCAGRAATIIGTEGNDILYGTAGPDVIAGLGGKDVILGLAGEDVICGGSGHDAILGGSGDDNLHGDAGNDTVDGGPGKDQIRGEAGDDSLYGGDGDDQMHGHGGKDYMRGGNGNDIIRGNDGDDRLYGDAGKDDLNGGAGNDRIDGQVEQTALGGGGSANTFQAASMSTAAGSMQGLRRMYPGIYYGTQFHANAHVVKVDLREPGITLHASGPPHNGKTTYRYARDAGMNVAVNGDWFSGRTPVGHAKTDGNLWHREFSPHWKAFGCNSRSECFLEPDVYDAGIKNVVGGNVQLLIKNGVLQTSHMSHTDRYTYYDPNRRTAVGLDATGRTLILLAVHSRSENFHSMALKMQALGAHNAMMLDGGGSTSMVVGGVSKVYSSRAVGNHVGIRHRTPGHDQTPVDIAVVNDSGARYVVYAGGRLRALGGARHRGDLSGVSLAKPIVGMALTPSKNGYWMVASDGGIFAFG
ncbi:MAG: phosphodiester glycosidase family protein, partial [Desulfobacterales bacterium]